MAEPKRRRRSLPSKRKVVSAPLKKSPKARLDSRGAEESALAAAPTTEDLEFERAFSAEALQRDMTRIAVLGTQVREYERQTKRRKRKQVKASAAGVAVRRQRKAELVRQVLKLANRLRIDSKPEREIAGIVGRRLKITSQHAREILKKTKPTSG